MFICKLNLLFLQILIILFFSSIDSKASNEDITKAMSCMNLVAQKIKADQSIDQKLYYSMILKCYITITEEIAKEILVGLEQGIPSLEKEEIDNLTDVNYLKNFSKEDLEKYSKQLEETFKDFKELQDKYKKNKDKTSDDYNDDEEYRKSHPSRGNTLGVIMRGMTGLLKLVNNMGSIIIIIIFFYFGSIMLGKCKKKEQNKEQNKDKNKNKNKNVKKKTE